MKPLAPRGADGQRLVERLPTYSDFRDQNIGIVVPKLLEARCCRKFQGMEARSTEGRTENRQASFRVERVGLPAGVREIAGTGRNNIANACRVIRILLQILAPELAPEGESHSAGR